MVSFWIYDVTFMILFSVFVAWFLSSRKKDLGREGIIFMYRTQFGVKLINYIGDNFKKLLNSIKYVIIGTGFLLMGIMVWMLGQTVSVYLLHPEVTKLIKAPPIAPLIPYFPKLFGMESFFPPFYFTYFIVALAIVAIVHEFSHGIYMRVFKIKIKSTGLAFLGPILGAFVEQEEKSFKSKKKINQMTVLAAGVFANLITALVFYAIYMIFFFNSFTASGYVFDSYAITSIPLENITGFEDYGNLTLVKTKDKNYYLDENLALQLEESNGDYLIAYYDSPAFVAQMKGAIIQANDVRITSHDKLREFLEDKNPGDNVIFLTETEDEIELYNITLGENPEDETKPYVGIGHTVSDSRGFVKGILSKLMSFKESSTLYKPTWDGDFVYFIYYLLWWVMVINLLVALFNMMPLGILDGGQFFHLAMVGIFKSEKTARRIYKIIGYLILLMFALMMMSWLINII